MQKSRRSFLKGAAFSAGVAAWPTVPAHATASQDLGERFQAQPSASGRLSDLVNVLQGTNSTPAFSRGNTLPLVAAPHGMGHWAVQTTSERSSWFFHPADPRIEGVRCTHQLSPWLGDYGHLTVLPFCGEPGLSASLRASSYRPEDLQLRPYALQVRLMRYRIAMELAPTERCAILQFTYSEPGKAGICVSIPGSKGSVRQLAGSGLYLFTSPENRGGVAHDFAAYYVAKLDVQEATLGFAQVGEEGLAALRFQVSAGQVVTLRIACSFISAEQARSTLERELGEAPIRVIRDRTADLWEKQLGRVSIETANEHQRRIFYSCLYRTSLFPRIWHEYNDSGQMIHRSPYNGGIADGPMYADHGFWDVYRAWYPMMTLLYPERLSEILQAWVNVSKEGGWLPQFPCPGYRGGMSGSPIDSVLADAAVKGIGGFDLETAYAGLYKEATTPVEHPFGFGRQGVSDYLKYGYLPTEKHGGALTETLDGGYGDFCIGQVAQILGRKDDAEMFLKRSRNWRNVFDPKVAFLRPRLSDGTWPPDFEPARWGGGYVEGSAWQYRVSVPHDPAGLIQLMGGSEKFVSFLQELVTMPPRFEVGDYGFEIHEMSEMAAVDFGQYAHSNQPSHHILYMFAEAGRADLTQHWVRRVLNELYTVNDFCGDEDTGAMAAWYVMSALGIYSLCPGRPEYTLGSPLFARASIHLHDGKQTDIVASGQTLQSAIISGATLNEKTLHGVKLRHADLASGSVLRCHMSESSPV